MFMYIIAIFLIIVIYKWIVGEIDFVYGSNISVSSSSKRRVIKDCIVDKDGFNSMRNKYDEKY
ncbi:hypothetical protein VA249_45150 (plasmid) [Vibrio alfacsensis]|nr:hypothetical protein VA249_45150 [Vibrio alfacsensis]